VSWITFAQNAAQFIIGPFGISIFAVLLGLAGMRVAIEHRWHAVGYTIAGGVITFAAAWAVTTFMQA
jgi:hypothetical protein